jgi:hypothetical protein
MSKQPQFAQPDAEFKYATEYALRHPKFKVHRKLMHARAARSNHAGRIWDSNPNWRASWASTPESFARIATFDIYQFVDGQWQHMPEESVNPDNYEIQARDDVMNQYAVDHYGSSPMIRTRIYYRPKETM